MFDLCVFNGYREKTKKVFEVLWRNEWMIIVWKGLGWLMGLKEP